MGTLLTFTEQRLRDLETLFTWEGALELEVGAHPALSATQQELIRHEYLAGAASKTLEVRQALAGYIVQDLRIATDISRDVPLNIS